MNMMSNLMRKPLVNMECQEADIRVMIADDHAIVRAGLQKMIETEPGMKVVATGEDGTSTLMTLRKTNVDVLLLDFSMPAPSGPELTATIRHCYPNLPVLIISMDSSPATVSSVMCAGANGYITKDRDPDELMVAIRQVVAGSSWLEPGMMRAVLHKQPEVPTLSARETEVLRMLAAGHRNHQIAEALFISEKTVSTHKTNVMSKLNLASMADLIRYADEKLSAVSV